MNLLTQRPPWLKAALTWVAIFVAANIACFAIVIGLAFGYEYAYAGKIYPGVTAAGVHLDGFTTEQAARVLHEAVDLALENGFRFRADGKDIMIQGTSIAPNDPDASRDLLTYDVDRAVQRAYATGRDGSFWRNTFTRFELRVRGVEVPLPFDIASDSVQKTLKDELKDLLVLPKDAELHVSVPAPHSAAEITVIPEQIGKAVDISRAVEILKNQAAHLSFDTIVLPVTTVMPNLRAADLEPLREQVPGLLRHAPFRVSAEEQSWLIASSTLATWLNATASPEGLALGIDPDRLSASLKPFVSDFLKESKDGNLIVKDGKVVAFEAPVEGIELNASSTIQAIESAWSHGSTTIPLVLERHTPLIQGDAIDMGIREILGIGHSNFSGSPANRRYNIALGAKKVNGSLIAPGEEFSLLHALGSVDGANGWKPELVIKGDKTTPEFGGGLCQIGTTTFRAAMMAGLQITERRNHSYRVRYYEPAGTDATIYEPSPDMKFKNDTDHWILFTTQVNGDSLAFTVWGTSDGRKGNIGTSHIYNIVAPPPKKIVETLDLPPGKTKCTETAHAGADASFDYTITSASGEVKKVTFNSHYRPWGAVCLLGVKELSPPAVTIPAIDQTGINNPN